MSANRWIEKLGGNGRNGWLRELWREKRQGLLFRHISKIKIGNQANKLSYKDTLLRTPIKPYNHSGERTGDPRAKSKGEWKSRGARESRAIPIMACCRGGVRSRDVLASTCSNFQQDFYKFVGFCQAVFSLDLAVVPLGIGLHLLDFFAGEAKEWSNSIYRII